MWFGQRRKQRKCGGKKWADFWGNYQKPPKIGVFKAGSDVDKVGRQEIGRKRQEDESDKFHRKIVVFTNVGRPFLLPNFAHFLGTENGAKRAIVQKPRETKTTKKPRKIGVLNGGRYRTRICDLLHVKQGMILKNANKIIVFLFIFGRH